MESIRIDIINPKAKKLLKDLAELKLIRIKKEVKSEFLSLLQKLRDKSSEGLSFDEITREVDNVRKSRYEK